MEKVSAKMSDGNNKKNVVVLKTVFSSEMEEKKSSKKPKETTKGKKRRGRPTNEEIRAQQQATAAADLALRKELIDKQRLAEATSSSGEAPKPIVVVSEDDESWVPQSPIYIRGQRVAATYYGTTYKGTVNYDNMRSPLVLISWDDGSIQYAARANLVLIKKRTYKHVSIKQKRQNSERVSGSDSKRNKTTARSGKKTRNRNQDAA